MFDAVLRPIHDHLPLWLLLLPLAGTIGVWIAQPHGELAVRRIVLGSWGASVVLTIWLLASFQPLKPATNEAQAFLGPIDRFQFRSGFGWLGETQSAAIEQKLPNGRRRHIDVPIRWGPDIRWEVGVDGLSLLFVALSVLLVGVALASRASRLAGQDAVWLWLQASLMGTFVALDVILFLICWMSTLLAVAWLLGNHGDGARHHAVPTWLKANFLGVWFAALGLGGLVLTFGWLRQSANRPQPPLIFSAPELIAGIGHWTTSGDNLYLWVQSSSMWFWLLVVGFTWPLLLAPLQSGFVGSVASAPSSVAMVLTGVLVKVGLYGWLRFIVPVFPNELHQHGDGLATIVGLSSFLAAVLALGQTDWRRKVALATSSSVGMSLLSILTYTLEGLVGSVLRLVAHGVTVALVLYLLSDRHVKHEAPVTSVLGDELSSDVRASRRREWAFRFALFAWIGLPGLSGFVAEFVTPLGLIQHEFNLVVLSLATSGVLAWMWVRADRQQPRWSSAPWKTREWLVVGTLLTLNVALGVAPQFVVSRIEPGFLSMFPPDHVRHQSPASQE